MSEHVGPRNTIGTVGLDAISTSTEHHWHSWVGVNKHTNSHRYVVGMFGSQVARTLDAAALHNHRVRSLDVPVLLELALHHPATSSVPRTVHPSSASQAPLAQRSHNKGKQCPQFSHHTQRNAWAKDRGVPAILHVRTPLPSSWAAVPETLHWQREREQWQDPADTRTMHTMCYHNRPRTHCFLLHACVAQE